MTAEQKPIRLNKLIAQNLAIGRRQADELIVAGKVVVDGVPARLGQPVTQSAHIQVNGHTLPTSPTQTFIYLLLNKPVGYVCSRRQQGGTPTIYTLLPKNLHHLKPVGRLDKNSSGLLLLTNDGDLAHRLTHPSFSKVKQYDITIDQPLEPLHQQLISDFGVNLPDGVSKLTLQKLQNAKNWQVTMSEGRNRQIRRTFGALGYTVTRLHRTRFGTLSLDMLGNAQYKEVSAEIIR